MVESPFFADTQETKTRFFTTGENRMETAQTPTAKKRELHIYFHDGRVFYYPVADATQARAHMDKIWARGYRSTANGDLSWYGPHYLDKIVYKGDDASTNYPDQVRGT